MARIHRTVQKNLHDPDNHDGVITHLEPDILESEVKWALENITKNKASKSDKLKIFNVVQPSKPNLALKLPVTLRILNGVKREHYGSLKSYNQDGVITHLEPDILECEVKWASGSITMNKASGGDELFQILKDDAVKVLHSICQQIWKTQQWVWNWKGQFSFQSLKKATPKNAQTTAQLHSSHMLTK